MRGKRTTAPYKLLKSENFQGLPRTADKLSSLLRITKDQAERKLRGMVHFSRKEVLKIQEIWGLSNDEVIEIFVLNEYGSIYGKT